MPSFGSSGGKIEIRSLCWRGRQHRVKQMHASWIDRAVQPPVHGFTVTLETDDLMELAGMDGPTGINSN